MRCFCLTLSRRFLLVVPEDHSKQVSEFLDHNMPAQALPCHQRITPGERLNHLTSIQFQLPPVRCAVYMVYTVDGDLYPSDTQNGVCACSQDMHSS